MIDFQALHGALLHYEIRHTDDVLPQLESMEAQRKKTVSITTIFSIITTIVGIAAFVYWRKIGFFDGELGVQLFSTGAVVAVVLIYPFRLVQTFQGEAKQAIMGSITDYLGWSYAAKMEITPDVKGFQKDGLLPTHSNSSSEDFIKGQYNDADFEFYELSLQQSNGKSSQTVFRGLIDPIFEDIFEAYSTDQVESRYLLTPDFMQRLVDLEAAAHGRNIRFGLLDSKLFVALQTGDHFEAGSIFSAMNDLKPIEKVLGEVSALLGLMDGILQRQALT